MRLLPPISGLLHSGLAQRLASIATCMTTETTIVWVFDHLGMLEVQMYRSGDRRWLRYSSTDSTMSKYPDDRLAGDGQSTARGETSRESLEMHDEICVNF
jgi:hypothetical protein